MNSMEYYKGLCSFMLFVGGTFLEAFGSHNKPSWWSLPTEGTGILIQLVGLLMLMSFARKYFKHEDKELEDDTEQVSLDSKASEIEKH